jgi:hypothetical protein
MILERAADTGAESRQAISNYMKAANLYIRDRKFKEAGFVIAKAARLSEGAGKTNLLYEAARNLIKARVYTAVFDILEEAINGEGNINLWVKLQALIQSFIDQLKKPEDKLRVATLSRRLDDRF